VGTAVATTQFVRVDGILVFGSPIMRQHEPDYTRVEQVKVPAETRIPFPYYTMGLETVTEGTILLKADQPLTIERLRFPELPDGLDSFLLPEYQSGGTAPLDVTDIVLATLNPGAVLVLTGLNGIDRSLLVRNATTYDATLAVLIAGELA